MGDTLYVLLGVGIASVVSHVFGAKDYSKIFAYISMIGFAAGSVGGFIITRLYEVAGSFQAVFVFCMCVCVLICACVLLASKLGKKLPAFPATPTVRSPSRSGSVIEAPRRKAARA